jgi:hydrogenase expression/formation protein HypC
MCLALPYKILRIKGNLAEIESDGTRFDVATGLFPDIKEGDWVLVNLGSVVSKIDENEAREINELYAAMLETASQS